MRVRLWFIVILGLVVMGCERVLSNTVEPRPYLDVPPEGKTVFLPPEGYLNVVVHFIMGREEASSLVLKWAGEGAVAGIQGQMPIPMEGMAPDIYRARLAVWPLEPLPPGTYRLWVEVPGTGYPSSGEARVRILSPEEMAQMLAEGAQSVALATSVPLPTLSPAFRPTVTLPPTNVPTITPTPLPCYRARFIADITLPDGTTIEPNRIYTKTWRLENTGSCTWPADAYPLWVGGDNLQAGSPTDYRLGRPVAPGQRVDVSTAIAANNLPPGTYRALYMLTLPDGTRFGVGRQGNKPFWVEVVIPQPTAVPTRTPTATPADTQGPFIGKVAASETQISPPPCTPNTVTINAYQVTDPSGVASVTLVWRVVDGSRAGPWTNTPMTSQGNNAYSVALDYATVEANLAPPYQNGQMQFRVKAVDVYGNVTFYPTQSLTVYSYCVQ